MEAADGRLTNALKGRRIHFAGSAKPTADPSRLRYAHMLLKHLAMTVLKHSGGLVLTLGNDPVHPQDMTLPLIFDWTLLEAVDEFKHWQNTHWPEAQGLPVVAVGLSNWRKRIPNNRQALFDRVVKTKNLELAQIRAGLSVGGVLREQQAMYGDILVPIGGGPGVEHLAQIYSSNRKPVIPFDIPLGDKSPSAAEGLSTQAMENPMRFFEYEPSAEAVVAYSQLSIEDTSPNIEDFGRRFLDFVSHLPRPRAFLVRLLNTKSPDFAEVERFFRNIVDTVLSASGYRHYEMGKDASTEPFLNVEIFKRLNHSSLVIADLTGLRADCFMEMGYAFGQAKKVIVTAREGTTLPFDSHAIPCHFWSVELDDEQRRDAFQQFMRNNINRKPLAS
jgi:hypothetical protein